jgi:hypothetical protein
MSRPTGLEKLVTGSSSSNPTRSLSRWSLVEDQALISSMNDLLDLGGWKADNGQFKSGSYAKLDDKEKHVTCSLEVWKEWIKVTQ